MCVVGRTSMFDHDEEGIYEYIGQYLQLVL